MQLGTQGCVVSETALSSGLGETVGVGVGLAEIVGVVIGVGEMTGVGESRGFCSTSCSIKMICFNAKC